MTPKWVVVSSHIVVGPFKRADDASAFIKTRPPQAEYRVMPLYPPEKK
jgi:hypothetical protein